MFPIYICEDQASIRQHISSHISDYYVFHPEYEKPDIMTFSDPHKLLSSLPERPNMGVYFLDIQLGSAINGLDLAKEIRFHDPRGFIVFITSYSEYAPKTFTLQVEAFDYLDKGAPNLNAQISSTLTKIHERYSLFQNNGLNNPRVELHCNRNTYFYFANEIIALTTSEHSHRIKLFTLDSTLDFNGSLNKIKRDLPSSHFIHCHRAYIINKNHIKSYMPMSHVVELTNHLQIPVSRENRHFFQ